MIFGIIPGSINAVFNKRQIEIRPIIKFIILNADFTEYTK